MRQCMLNLACALLLVPALGWGATPRNVIFMLGDGMGYAQVNAYRMYADDPGTPGIDPLAIDAHQVGSVATASIDMRCGEWRTNCERDPYAYTDSAAAATAYATGRDTLNRRISRDQDDQVLPTLLEGARQRGKATGLVATSQLTHASPAAFATHASSRYDSESIANQLIDNRWQDRPIVDVLLGGGLEHLSRPDRDLVAEFRQEGYEVALTRSSLLQASGPRVLGVFAPQGMPKAWDRAAEIPSLADMTRVALKTLATNPEGFFLFVEGSQIDWAAHGNSVPGVISEMEDFIAATEVAMAFARKDGDTLVVILADHETGGMALGLRGASRWNPAPLKGLKATPAGMSQAYVAGDEALSAVVGRNIAFSLAPAEIAALDDTPRTEEASLATIVRIFNARTMTGWTSDRHTGVDVPLYVLGPGSERFGGVMQNEAVGQTLREVFLPER